MSLKTYENQLNERLVRETSPLIDKQQSFDSLSILDLFEDISGEKFGTGVFGAISNTAGIQLEEDKANQKSYLQSRNFSSGNTGYQLDSDGNIEGNKATFRGDVYINDSKVTLGNIFGDGSDGDVDVNSGSFSSGPITNNALTRDAFFDNLTLSGGDLDTAGYRLFVKTELTINSGYKIERNGNAGGNGSNGEDGKNGFPQGGSGGTAGSALSGGTIKGGIAGTAGSTGVNGTVDTDNNAFDGSDGTVGSDGTNQSKSVGSDGADSDTSFSGDGGDAGSKVGGSGASGGVGGDKTGTNYMPPRIAQNALNTYEIDTSGNVTFYVSSPASGGAAGGASGACTSATDGYVSGGAGGGGGGSGSSGGIVLVIAKKLTNEGTIEATGGNGGNGGNGGDGYENSGFDKDAGGGGGGAGGAGDTGGVIILLYSTKEGSGSEDISGGSAGSGGTKGVGIHNGGDGTDGDSGVSGASGTLIEMEV